MKKILIVDDEEKIRSLVEVTLSVGNYNILHAKNGEEAILIARDTAPDLVLVDTTMPGGMDGVATIRVLKNDPETRKAKIIILASRGHETDVEKAFAAGADDYFIKPFNPFELMRKVEKTLGR